MSDAREKFIGGSDIAAIMGLSRWSTPLKVWAEKTGKIQPKDLSDVEYIEIGTELEEYVARKFSKKTGYKVRRDQRAFTHPKYGYMVGHIDRWILGEDALLECKTTSAWNAKEWEGEEMPKEYILQVNWYLGLVCKSVGYIACLIGGQRFAWKQIAFDADLFEKQVQSAKEFWENHVLADSAPIAMTDDSEILQMLFPDPANTTLTFEGEKAEALNSLIEERQGGLEAMALTKDEVEKLSNQIKQTLGEASYANTGAYQISWKKQRVAPFINTDAMKHDGVYQQYEAENYSRVLRTKKLKGETA